ncbi:MAG: sensor histidine kinase [Anaerolineae bacterium]
MLMEHPAHSPHPLRRDAWLRWLPLWWACFVITVLALTLAATTEPGVDIPRVLFLAALFLVWYGVSLRWQRREDGARGFYLLAYHIVGWLVWIALTDLNPVYMLTLFVLFPHLFMSLPLRWASIGAILLMSFTILRQIMLPDQTLDTWVILFSVTTIAGIILASFIEAIIKESTVRRDLILKLETTQRELVAAERQAGVLHERQRLAGEIHDTVAQGLTGVITHLEAADSALQMDQSAAQRHMNQARDVARSSLAEARRFIWGMRPEALEKQPVETAVKQLVDDWSASTGIVTHWHVTGTRASLSPEQETVLLRVIQEALANAAKHAQAQHVTITLSYLPDMLVVDIKDDGRGFDPDRARTRQADHSGYGLRAMRERLAAVNGRLTVESTSGEGTTIVAEISLNGVTADA